MPFGMKPPWAVRWLSPPPPPGQAPTMKASPRHRNTTMAATLMEANQYSASPQERTDSRLRSVKDSTSARVSVQGGAAGNQNASRRAPATASSATTITQKYQYIHPVRKPARE